MYQNCVVGLIIKWFVSMQNNWTWDHLYFYCTTKLWNKLRRCVLLFVNESRMLIFILFILRALSCHLAIEKTIQMKQSIIQEMWCAMDLKETSEKRTSSLQGTNGLSPMCVLFGGFTVYQLLVQRVENCMLNPCRCNSCDVKPIVVVQLVCKNALIP